MKSMAAATRARQKCMVWKWCEMLLMMSSLIESLCLMEEKHFASCIGRSYIVIHIYQPSHGPGTLEG